MKYNKKRLYLSAGSLVAAFVLITTSVMLLTNADLSMAGGRLADPNEGKPAPVLRYGYDINNFQVAEGVIRRNESLSELLEDFHVTTAQVDELMKAGQGIFDFRSLKAEKEYMILANPQNQQAQYFIYEPTPYYYIVCDFTSKPSKVTRIDRKVDLVERSVAGEIKSSLWDAFEENDLDFMLSAKMEAALKYSIDFFRIKKGDRFKLMFTEKWVEGKRVGIDKLTAAYMESGDDAAYAFLYAEDGNDENASYYDENARPLKKAFLKAPVEFSRISSRYNLKRMHPILGYVKPHLGTDFSAPQGTPILAIADGTVEVASRGSGNGIFVKIKHDQTYSSQYLHMCRHAKGMKPGVRVTQGQVIGYVGSTGLSTGPHCCFRFWKNGQQVDFLKEKLPRANPIVGEAADRFFVHRDSVRALIDVIPFASDTSRVNP